MELKIGVQELARALARSQGIVEKKSTMPILSHVLLEATKTEGLHVSATDLDISVSSDHACEVLKEGKVAIPAKQLYEIVKALPEKDPEAGLQQLPRAQERCGRVSHRRSPGRRLPGAAALRQGRAGQR
jgi:DNA polymerase III sliding clamp (beta) subunit (PCNA family)